MEKEKQDYSKVCDHDDDNLDNDCFNCVHFMFPAGCMDGED